MKVYVASRLENADQISALMQAIQAVGFEVTYDWTRHRRGDHNTAQGLQDSAHSEISGVAMADCLIAVLPGGSGTHVEIGAALALGKPVLLVSEDKGLFDPVSSKACSFYHHLGVDWLPGFLDAAAPRIAQWLIRLEQKLAVSA